MPAFLNGARAEAPFNFPRSAPEAQGVSSSAILRFVDEADQKLDALHSFMLVRHGRLSRKGGGRPTADEPHMLFSLEDIARFGQLYLQKGQWQGKQIVPAVWVVLRRATRAHA